MVLATVTRRLLMVTVARPLFSSVPPVKITTPVPSGVRLVFSTSRVPAARTVPPLNALAVEPPKVVVPFPSIVRLAEPPMPAPDTV